MPTAVGTLIARGAAHMRLAILASSILLSSLVPACATDVPADELANEGGDGEAGKADAAGAFTYFTVTPDLRACSLGARCGGFFIARPNRSTTACGLGVTKSRCYVDAIDWSGTAMPASVAASYEERLRAGETLIVKGDLAAADATHASLAATEIWVAGSATGVTDGVFVLVKDNGVRCITAPCPSTTETRLNSTRHAAIAEVDFTPSGAADDDIANASAQIGDAGVIVVGDRFYGTAKSKGRTANQFFTRAPVPLF